MKKIDAFFDKFLNSPLQLKLFFASIFILFAFIISLIVFIINYNYESRYVSSTINEKAETFFNSKTEYLEHYIQKYKKSIESVLYNDIFKEYVEARGDKKLVISYFEHIIASDNNVMQLRYIDKNGMEKIRLDRAEKNSFYRIIEDKSLQNKKDGYYFIEVSKQKENSKIWLSDIDLNIEHGKIQVPYVSTLRFASPVYSNGSFEGMVIMNIFMNDILDYITASDMFVVSLMDKEGEFLVGKQESGGKLLDYSWSRYLLKKIDIKSFAPSFMDNMLNAQQFNSRYYFSKRISKDAGLYQDLILVLKVKNEKIEEIKSTIVYKILDTIGLVLLVSGPIGLVLAYIPSLLAKRVFNATKKLEEKTIMFDEYLEAMNINNIISKSDKKGRITYVNDNFCRVSGYSREEVLGKPHSLLRDPDTPKSVFKVLWLTIQSGKTWTGILRNRKKGGGYYDVDIAIMPIYNTQNEIMEYLAIRHDITELMEQRKSLIDIATKDQLTGVANRYKLNMEIQKHHVNNIAVIDIDKFSSINDFYGHSLGDEIIRKFANLLEENLTDEFTLYRLHSDKFAIHNFTLGNTRFVNFINHLNTKMIESVIDTEVESFDIVTTTGISSCDNEIIISTAEIANKHAKKLNKKVLVYSSDLDIEKEFEKNIIWTQKVKKALMEDRIIVYYQPLFNNHTKKIEKYELLVRLKDEDGSIVSPFYFLDIAKSSGQYIDITKTIIRKSFKKFRDIDMEFSINLTIEDILNKELFNYLEDMINKYQVSNKLVVEIVESEGIEEFKLIQNFIKRLKFLGCKIAIDDFGTGYSNFEYLVKLEPDYIKLDGSMIKNINTDENMKEIVKTILEFAKKMNYKTIGEFVASKEILKTVQELDIDYSQGYYIGAPEEELIS